MSSQRSAISDQPSTRRRGFALLIVITLLAFIVVLLLGLAVYTRVETAVAGNTQRQAQARENALLALNVALGQLQKYAGPDTRVTATAQNFGAIDGTHHYTGVWSSDAAASTTPGTPMTWLVSGNELTQPDPDPDAPSGSTIPAPLAITPAVPGNRTVDLIGRNLTGNNTRIADYVVAPLTDITAVGVPGAPPAAATTIGRYAWWVGDQGVKAPVAIPDTSSAVTFAPYDSADLRSRIRQQMSLGAGATDASSGAPILEPRDGNNASLVANQKVAAVSQIAFLRTSSNAQIGLARLRQNLHAWSPNNFAVLANTKNGGLRQDLSLNPSLLGEAFAAWTNFPAYMETFVPVVPDPNAPPPPPSTTPTILPAYSADPIRRRYVMTPHLRTNNGSHQVGPVLSDFALAFNVRTHPTPSGGPSMSPQPLEVRAAMMLSLWNPYTSALVPEEITTNIEGLPDIEVVRDSDGAVLSTFSLQTLFGNLPASTPSGSPQLSFLLPWNKDTWTAGDPEEDRASWLPGRVYTWRSIQSSGALPSTPLPTRFYTRSFTATGESNEGIVIPLPYILDGSEPCFLRAAQPSGSTTGELTVTLTVIRNGQPERLGQFVSPPFDATFDTTVAPIGHHAFQFGYVFRLKESVDNLTSPSDWLTTPTIDFRRRQVQGAAYRPDQDLNPAVYTGQINNLVTAKPDRLLFRAGNGLSYNEDMPLFELPRSPLLSLGALQHFRIWNSRPFMIGNPWGVGEQLNNVPLGEIFDRFFFSGLVEGMIPDTSPNGELILPNPLLKPLRKPDETKLTIDDVRHMFNPPVVLDPDGNPLPGPAPSSASSKFFLQGGAFNLNSTRAAAWAAVLRGVRFPAPQSFAFLDTQAATGTGDDATQATVQSTDAQFFRFSQSAQETYKAEEGMADNDPTAPSPARTELFRRGMRTLSEAQVAAFAAKIVELLALKHAAPDPDGGPIRSLDEFLSPSALYAGLDAAGNPSAPRSLLEAAIADANLNIDAAGNPIEFSSQYLTQGDVMTALAPVLFPRSDTFVIRTYGEAVNPTKLPVTYRPGDNVPADAIEGRAWAEAIVQRVPEFFADAVNNPPDTDAAVFDTPSDPNDPTSSPSQAHQLNKLYGRRFKVVSFRWLTRSDI